MNQQISTEIIFNEKQEISAVEIFIGHNKFTLTGIEENRPLNYYISPDKLRGYLRDHALMEEGKIINLTDKLTLSKWDKNSKNEVNPK
jgi:hypothetical protein